ncbi:MAG: transketolase family protein [Selenomonadaceae bacterium]|nr:transketolase family protein [Selenomonadaceae bacterium]
MAEVKKIATRESYGATLLELGRLDDKIVVMDADLAGSTKSGVFGKEFPDRFFNCGIAEQNMIGVAAGLATMGLKPFVSTFAMFAVCRPYEQIRSLIGYPRLNVKICASHGGVSVGADGASHQCCEDFALMRTIPGMLVMCPSDDVEARQMVKAAYNYDGPVYIRFARAATPVYHDADYKFEVGKGEIVSDGNDVAIIANGIVLPEVVKAAAILKAEGISARVINMGTIKPVDKELVIDSAKACGKIITVEEHTIIGGLGEAVCSVLAENYPAPVKRIGINDEFGYSAEAEELLKAFGLCAEEISATARAFVNGK